MWLGYERHVALWALAICKDLARIKVMVKPLLVCSFASPLQLLKSRCCRLCVPCELRGMLQSSEASAAVYVEIGRVQEKAQCGGLTAQQPSTRVGDSEADGLARFFLPGCSP